MAKNEKIFKMSFASVYVLYIQKAEKKGRTKDEVDEIIKWLTSYSQDQLDDQVQKEVSFEDFFAQTPQINPHVDKITGMICGYRVEDMEEGLMKNIRYMDKLIDELARGKKMDKILRS